MNGWLLDFESNIYYSPSVENMWTIETSKLLAKYISYDEPYICTIQDRRGGKHHSRTFYHKAGVKKTEEHYYTLFVKKNFMKTFVQQFRSLQRLHHKHFRKLAKNNLEDMKIIKNISILGGMLHKLTQARHFGKLERELNTFAKQRFGKKKELLLELLQTDKLISAQKEKISWLQLIILMHKGFDYRKKLTTHRDKFFSKYVIARTHKTVSSIVISIQELEKKLLEQKEQISIQEARKEIQEILEHAKQVRNRKKEISIKYKFTKEEERIFKIYSDLAYYRLEGRNIWISYYAYISHQKELFCKRHTVKSEDFDCLNFEEYCRVLKEDSTHRLGCQSNYMLRYKEKDKHLILFNKRAVEESKRLDLPENFEENKTLRGEVSYGSGTVKGTVRVIKWDNKFESSINKMKKGEILVVDQTKPDLLPAIRKAKAIITNEGGFISHAAIISQELHIPCIIQTGQATRVLHTGDTIELNLKTGEVKR